MPHQNLSFHVHPQALGREALSGAHCGIQATQEFARVE